MIDELAERGYGDPDQPYDRARPAYPAAAVTALLEALRLGPGGQVVELGAGTGIFTRQLLVAGLRVTAVEPVAAMRAKLPATGVVDGTAEQTGLPDATADAVVAATAWHWFDAAGAQRECRRLLRPGGGLGLLWNSYDESVPWVAELARVADSRRPAHQPSERSGRWREAFTELPDWEPLQTARFPNPWHTDSAGVLDRVLSSSVVAALPDEERGQVQDEVGAILNRHGLPAAGPVTLPYVTSIYWTRPL